MPIYEFACEKCGKKFEYLVRSSAEEPCCPKCGSGSLKRLISSFSFSSKDSSGNTASSSGCSGCSGGNCASCGH